MHHCLSYWQKLYYSDQSFSKYVHIREKQTIDSFKKKDTSETCNYE